jgi:hypothetical protein
MKQSLFIASAILTCSVFSCNSKDSGGMSDKAKKNLEAATAVMKTFGSGDYSKLGDYIAADGVDHTSPGGEVKGIDSIKAEFDQMGKMMSDFKYDVVKEIADDDYVFQWAKESWTMKTDGMGMKAGDKGSGDFIEVSKFDKDGKNSDHWSFISFTDMMKMMTPPPPMINKMDSTKKK